MIIVNHHPQGGKAKTLAHTHEYMLTCVNGDSDRSLVGRGDDEAVEMKPFKEAEPPKATSGTEGQTASMRLLVDPGTKRIVGLESPPRGGDYPVDATEEGYKRVYPIGVGGEERVWRRSYESCVSLVEKGKLQCTDNMTIYQAIEAHERTAALFSNWVDPRYNAGTFGANLLREIIGAQNPFSTRSRYTRLKTQSSRPSWRTMH